MAGRNEIELIRERADMLEIVSRYVSLKKAGKNYIGSCPFHQDKTPSFTVNPEKKLFHCFGCNEGGDLFQFLMKIERIDFAEALARLAAQTGVPIRRERPSPLQKLKELNERVCLYFQTNLVSPAGQKAREYLKQRGFSKEIIERFRLGYALPRWDDLAKKFSGDAEALETLGLALRRKDGALYDRFRDRLIFPIWSPAGEIIGFAGRTLGDEEPKYLNISNTPLFEKGTVLYGLNFARHAAREETLIIVEGYTDVISAHQAGIEHVVAGMGTALTGSQAQLLKRFASRVILAYDRDAAGRAATLRGLAHLRNSELDVSVALLPPEHDPDSFIRAHGREAFFQILQRAIPFHEFYLHSVLEDHPATTLAGKEKILQNVREFLPLLASVAVRHEIIRELGRVLNLPEEEVARAVKAGTRASIMAAPVTEESAWGPEEQVLHFVLQGDLPLSRVREHLDVQDFTRYPEIARALWELSEPWTVEEVLERLSAEDQVTVRRLVLQPPPLKESDRSRALAEVLWRLRQVRLEEKIARLREEVRAAERAGDRARVWRLQAELVHHQQQLLHGGRR
uniref:DNA primase n=2 Tax=Candidatus Bipolaricaulota TaxID=67810 RepID=H5SJI9_9BACT|nr:DNA primase [uncultured Acetothermia bacterium]BAL60133.1 DNA primase [Candidatus Acetothermum autotrophicum]